MPGKMEEVKVDKKQDRHTKYKDTKTDYDLKCMYTNIRSILNRNKKEELMGILTEHKIDILGITESWTHTEIGDAEINLMGYQVFRKDRKMDNGKKTRGGGVLLYVREKLIAYEIHDFDAQCEALWVGVRNKHLGELVIGVCYKSPNAIDFEVENLYSCIKHYSQRTAVIMGDFNYGDIDWDNMATTGDGSKFIDLVQDCFLEQHVKEATRGDRTLDLAFSSEPTLVEEVTIGCPVANSDHNVIYFRIPRRVDQKVSKQEVYNYHKADYVKICEKLDSIDWDKQLQGSDVEQLWQIVKEELIKCRCAYVPKRKLKKRKFPLWMRRHIVKMIKTKDKLWKRFKERPSYENQRKYNEIRNKVSFEIRQAKRNFELKLAENIKEDPKTFYAYARSKSKAKVGIGPLKLNGKLIEGDFEVAKHLNDYFATVFTREDINNVPQAEVEENQCEILQDIDITFEKVQKSITSMKPNKAAGVDELVSSFIKGCAPGIIEPLVDLIKKSLQETSVPLDWKMANVTAIFKKGSRGDPANYRPVSLTSNVCKIMERIIKEEIVQYLKRNTIIKDSQHGFRSKKSCLTNLLEFMEKVSEQLDSGEPVDVIYLDFQKAFDKVPHVRLLAKLEAIGIKGRLFGWIKEWLTGRKQRVVINGMASDWEDVLSGIPQGSILGPLLFIIFINDLELGIKNNILKFADDTKLFGGSGTRENIEKLRMDLLELCKWSEKWQMKFNIDKCKVMHIGVNLQRQIMKWRAIN